MNKIIILSLIIFLSACSTIKKEAIPEPLIDMNNINPVQFENIQAKNKALISYFNKWNIGAVGFDPYVIANYHIDLGCGYYFVKQHNFIDSLEEHSELYALQFYRGDTTNFRTGDDNKYCTQLHRNIVLALVDDKQIYQRGFLVKFTPTTKLNWTIKLTVDNFSPILNASNLSRKSKDRIELPGYTPEEDNIYIYSCSKYEIRDIINKEKIIIKYERSQKKLRPSENSQVCSN